MTLCRKETNTMTLYTATINRPGYLPDSDEPAPLFRTPDEAWRYLYEEHTAAWNYDNSDELHLETDTQFHTQIYHDVGELHGADGYVYSVAEAVDRSEEHTSELQSRGHL